MSWTSDLPHTLSDWMDDAPEHLGSWAETQESDRSFPWLPLLLAGAAAAGAIWLARNRREELTDLAVRRMVEQPAEGQSFLSLEESLQSSGEQLAARAAKASDTERNRERLRHIIGIERWGRARVQSAVLHRPWVMDEHHDYKPPKEMSMTELTEIFAEQRRRTAALAHSLHEQPPRLNDKVMHNEFGPLSVRGWLRYLQLHAEMEGRRLL
ncbi:DinB family protein [Deinococcus sp. Marseille-Q6407]|uniref:DinB family protein n=1 Tax=Deinococcus sp. Marseille-Q6407 TaxID=2969223 RepID=UPI0021C24E15|nr:DinB family protein [Deinococcus sp. Marseille-Q6407]